ncbi:MAG: NAD-dependent epimerase/dehydratase family protein [Crocinitomicaceae bacterium]
MARILITGITGTIGSELATALKKEGHTVEGVSGKKRIQDQGYFDAIKTPETIDAVYHLAAKTFVPDSWESPDDFSEVNILGTHRTLEFCRKNSAKIIFISSYAYGIPQYLPIDEKHPVSAVNPYALTKMMGEDLCHFYGKHYNLSYVIIRPFNVYGALGNKSLLIPEIIEQIKEGKQVRVKDLAPKRDFIFIDDLIDLLIRLLDYNKNETFNAGSGESLSVEEVIACCQRVFATDLPVYSTSQKRKNEIPETLCDMRFVEKELNWKPGFTFEAGVNMMKTRLKNG